jgi:hypothetical protein
VFLAHEFPDLRLLFLLGSRSQFGSASSRFSSVETSPLLPCPILCCVRCSPLLSSGCVESEATDSVSLCHCLSSRLSSPSVNPAGPALGFSLASLAGLAPAVLFSALVSPFRCCSSASPFEAHGSLCLAAPRTSDPPAVRRPNHSCSHVLLLKPLLPVHFPIVGSSNPSYLLRC